MPQNSAKVLQEHQITEGVETSIHFGQKMLIITSCALVPTSLKPEGEGWDEHVCLTPPRLEKLSLPYSAHHLVSPTYTSRTEDHRTTPFLYKGGNVETVLFTGRRKRDYRGLMNQCGRGMHLSQQ